jgi:hypothetical protein
VITYKKKRATGVRKRAMAGTSTSTGSKEKSGANEEQVIDSESGSVLERISRWLIDEGRTIIVMFGEGVPIRLDEIEGVSSACESGVLLSQEDSQQNS